MCKVFQDDTSITERTTGARTRGGMFDVIATVRFVIPVGSGRSGSYGQLDGADPTE